MHFNATVTGVFTLPHKLFTSTLPLGIYHQEISAPRCFSLCPAHRWHWTVRRSREPCAVLQKGARGLSTPLFWLVGSSCSAIGLWRTCSAAGPGQSAGAGLLGLDNFCRCTGLFGTRLCLWLGEWFLRASSLFIPAVPAFCSGAAQKAVVEPGADAGGLYPVHLLGWGRAACGRAYIPEFVGMTPFNARRTHTVYSGPAAAGGAVLAQPRDGKITRALAGAGVFILLALAALLGPPVAPRGGRTTCQNILRGVPCASRSDSGAGRAL